MYNLLRKCFQVGRGNNSYAFKELNIWLCQLPRKKSLRPKTLLEETLDKRKITGS